MICQATVDDHCCWVGGVVCPHFDPKPAPDAGGHCALRAELGDWSAVHVDVRYLEDVRPAWDKAEIVDNCGDWWPEEPCAVVGCGAVR